MKFRRVKTLEQIISKDVLWELRNPMPSNY